MVRAPVRRDVLPDGRPDPCPDVFSVKREPGGVFVCAHFPSSSATKPCCTLTVTKQPGETDIDVLMRADREVDLRHQQRASLLEVESV